MPSYNEMMGALVLGGIVLFLYSVFGAGRRVKRMGDDIHDAVRGKRRRR